MTDYELMYILHPRLTSDEIEQAVERITGLITGAGGEIVSVDQWGRRRLAYPIDRNLEGYYVLTTYNADPSTGGPLEGQLNLSADVLRHLLIRGIIPYEGPPREERPADRGSREPAPAPPAEGAEGEASAAPAEASLPAEGEAAAEPEAAAAESAAEPEAAATEETVAEPEAAEAAPDAETETAPPEQPEAAAPAEEAGEEEEQAAAPAAE
jgi:small subunit ribosomal protein S6